MSETNIERLQGYFRRQYELEEGSAEENIRDLFAEDAIIQTEDGATVSLEDIIRAATVIRQVPKSERIMDVSDLQEEGDVVSFRSLVRFRNPETDEVSELDTDTLWRFDEQGKVIESKSGASIVSAMR